MMSKTKSTRVGIVVALTFALAATPTLGQESGREEFETRRYEAALNAGAFANALDRMCLTLRECRRVILIDETRGFVAVEATPAGHERIAELAAELNAHLPNPQIRITLVEAHREENGVPEELSEDARAALSELGDFLPYRSFTHIDSAMIRSLRDATLGLAGWPGFGGYRATFRVSGTSEMGFVVEDFELAVPSGRTPDPYVVMSASVRIGLGETVIVGTARMPDPNNTRKAEESVLLVLLSVEE